MSKEYTFEFLGTKEEFLSVLNRFPKNSYSNHNTYYFDDHIVEIIDDEIRFGVARAGYSGGYWFIPTINELDNKIRLSGTIQYIGHDRNGDSREKIINSVGEFLLFILALPICLIIKFYILVEWVIRKICNCPKPKEKTEEERLFDLMENHFGCLGGVVISVLLSTIILSVGFFKKRGLGFKVIACVLWPITFGVCVYAGIFSYIPYQIYNIVKIVSLTREEKQQNSEDDLQENIII